MKLHVPFIGLWFFCLGIMASFAIRYTLEEEPRIVTYKKSSDTEWEISPKRMPDTIIIDTVIISGQIATPTVQYINIKIK